MMFIGNVIWISVDDENTQPAMWKSLHGSARHKLIVCTKIGNIHMAYLDDDKADEKLPDFVCSCGCAERIFNVTYWAELPKTPQT